MKPTAKATGTRLIVEASKLFVHAPLELGVQLRPRTDDRRLARPRPAPCEPTERQRAEADPDEGQHPRKQVEPLLRRLCQHGRPELQNELALDLALRVTGRDAGGDVLPDAVGDRG